jgi:opacity protein-like surface antigen
MSPKRLITLIAVACSLGTISEAGGRSAAYVGGAVGPILLRDSTFEDDLGNLSEASFQPGFSASMFGGYDFGLFRPEGQVRLLITDVDKYEDGTSGPRVDGDLSAVFFMVNGWFDFENRSPVTPYAGGGFGLANIHISRITSRGMTLFREDDETVPAYQAGAGINVDLARRVVVELGYRLLITPDPSFKEADAEFQGAVYQIGARILLGSVPPP